MAYTYNYLGLVNRVLEDFNEVLLTSMTFPSATGFQGTVKDYINDALNDIYAWNDVNWPFLWVQKTFLTSIGQGTYSYDASVLYVNWDTFNVLRPSLAITSLTAVGTTVTVTVAAGHQLKANNNDLVIINNAADTIYNGTWTPTIVSPTVFTYVASQAPVTSPDIGSAIMIPPYNNQYLGLKNYDEYLRDWRDVDINSVEQDNTIAGNPITSPPRFIIRKPDNNFIISPYPDRIYTSGYDALINPDSSLITATDVPLVPSVFRQVIIDRAMVYCLAFRDNDTQLLRNDKKFEDNCHRMRRILIPQAEFIVSKN